MALLWVALFTLAGCNSEITTVHQGEQADGMMPVSIQVHTADYSNHSLHLFGRWHNESGGFRIPLHLQQGTG